MTTASVFQLSLDSMEHVIFSIIIVIKSSRSIIVARVPE